MPADASTVGPTAVTIGTFDGVHLGHQALLKRARDAARTGGLTSLALTFRRPPQNELGHPKALLLPPDEKLDILAHHVDRVGVLDFQGIRDLSPEAFVTEVLRGTYDARFVVTGSDFRFGRDRRGDVATLRSLGSTHGLDVEVVGPVESEGRGISSTIIRDLLRQGEIRASAKLLGRPPRLVGRVVSGAGEGKRIGYPTANLEIDPEVLVPADGIYAAWARTTSEDERDPSALYIGTRPTYNAQERSVEVHLLEPPRGSLHGEPVRVEMVDRVRPDQKFDSVEALKAQIEADLDEVRRILTDA